MKQFKMTVKDTVYDIEILDDPRGSEVQVRVNGEEFLVQAEMPQAEAAPSAAVARPAAPRPAAPRPAAPRPAAVPVPVGGAGTVKSPLPGVINSMKVRTGQQVKANDELCVIEAMKAMNIIRAPHDGTIGQIYVQAGAQIAHGAPILDIE